MRLGWVVLAVVVLLVTVGGWMTMPTWAIPWCEDEVITTTTVTTTLTPTTAPSDVFREALALWYRTRPSDQYFIRHSSRWRATYATPLTGGYTWPGKDCMRLFAFLDWSDWSEQHKLRNPTRLLYTDVGDPELALVRAANATLYSYNRQSFDRRTRNDMHDMAVLPDDHFDLAVFGQTLEVTLVVVGVGRVFLTLGIHSTCGILLTP